MNRMILAAVLAFAAAPALAAPVAYTLDPAHTQTTFTVDRFGFTTIMGAFTAAEGTIWIDEADPASSRVEAFVTVASLYAGDPTREDHVKGPRWLNGAVNPTIRFVSTKVVPTGSTTADVTGDFTLNGVTRPVTFKVALNKIGKAPGSGKQSAGFTITGSVQRRDFGIGAALPPGLIGETVDIRIEALGVSAMPVLTPAAT
ncbi:MAG: YceI family protein [Caulobacter sp.]|nr:YceI family protein [Caulobacter sp.]